MDQYENSQIFFQMDKSFEAIFSHISYEYQVNKLIKF